MVQIAEQVRRTRGRPPIRSDEETRRLLIEAAAAEFQANGYAGTWPRLRGFTEFGIAA